MSQNLHIQKDDHIDNYFMVIVNLQEFHRAFRQEESPISAPDYCLPYNTSVSRMGGQMQHVAADNKDLLLALIRGLKGEILC